MTRQREKSIATEVNDKDQQFKKKNQISVIHNLHNSLAVDFYPFWEFSSVKNERNDTKRHSATNVREALTYDVIACRDYNGMMSYN